MDTPLKKKVLTVVLTFSFIFTMAQTVSRTQIFPKYKFNHLLKSPIHLDCDSLGSYYVICSLWYNKMPMSDNSKINWGCGIAKGEHDLLSPACYNVTMQKVYFFYSNEVYVFNYGTDKNLKREGFKKIYAAPEHVVIEYYDSLKCKKGYLKNIRGFEVGEVQ